MIYIIFILIGIIVGMVVYLLVPPRMKMDDDFKREIKLLADRGEAMKAADKKKIEEELEEYRFNLEVQLEELENKKKQLQVDFDEEVKSLDERFNKLYDENREALSKRTERLKEKQDSELLILMNTHAQSLAAENKKFEEAAANYEEKLVELKHSYEEKENEINSIITTKKEELNNLIAQFKKDEEARIEKDFYRIAIKEDAQNDIEKLRLFSKQLNSPIVLYKMIWEEYYKSAFGLMTGRVLAEKKESSGIYKITNARNQMCYIGQSCNLGSRWKTHVRRALKIENGPSNKLYDAMFEEGPESFTFQVLEFCPKDKLNEREKFFIEFYNAKEYGYNSKI